MSAITLYIYIDSLRCTNDESIRRISLCYGNHKYVMTYADQLIYIVKIVIQLYIYIYKQKLL